MSPRRPLRWPRFAFFLVPACVVVARGWPGARALAGLLQRGHDTWSDPAEVVAGAALFAFGGAMIVRLVADAGWDRRVGRPALVAILLAAFLPIAPPVRADANAALARCARRLVERLQQGEAAAPPPGCAHTGYRDRRLRRLPLRVIERPGDGPVRRVPLGVEPGTLLVARGDGPGWVTAVGLGADGPALLRRGPGIWVGGFTRGGEG